MYKKRLQTFLQKVRVLVYAIVKEHARPYETLREQAAVTVIAIEKPSKVVYPPLLTVLLEFIGDHSRRLYPGESDGQPG
jgi:hypothetical protein